MKPAESKSSTETSSTGSSTISGTHAPTFAKVADGRKQPIRGLWVRNGRFYAQLKVENPITGIKKTKRIPLKDKDGSPVETVAQAKEEMARLKTQRSDNALPVLCRTPKFSDYAADYLAGIVGKKSPGTVQKERAILDRWSKRVGELRLDQIKRIHVNRFIDSRLREKAAPRTINLDVIAFRNAMKRAREDGTIQRLPTEGLAPLKTTTRKRSLVTTEQIDRLCSAGFETKKAKNGQDSPVTENAQQFADYVRLMAYSGTRRNEALGLQWRDVDFEQRQIHLRRQIKPVPKSQKAEGNVETATAPLKNKEERVLDFNPKLEAHLRDMFNRRAPDSIWLFPSPQRGEKDIPAQTFRESLDLARTRAGFSNFGFHDCRHHFISMCVMSGIDFMTIAAWVGHRDGGVLIGKVYGHLANEHRRAMADKLTF